MCFLHISLMKSHPPLIFLALTRSLTPSIIILYTMLRVKDRYALYTPFYNIEEGKNPKWMCKGCSFSRVGAPSIARLHILGDSGKMCPKSRKNGWPKDALEAFMELHEGRKAVL